MIRTKLMKSVMLGLSLSTFSTGIAFAQMSTTIAEPSAAEALSPELEALYAKQAEIDQYIFKDHAKDIEAKGIFVNFTGVNVDAVEIGISPFNDENANYFYDIFGKDGVRVVEFDESVIFETTVAMTDAGVTDPSSVTEDAAVAEGVDVVKAPDTVTDDKVYKESNAEMTIQIESTEGVPEEDSDTIYYTTAADAVDDVQTVSAAELPDAVKRGSEEEKEGTSTSMTVLAIAAGAAIVGGAVVVAGKKKSSK